MPYATFDIPFFLKIYASGIVAYGVALTDWEIFIKIGVAIIMGAYSIWKWRQEFIDKKAKRAYYKNKKYQDEIQQNKQEKT